MKKLIIIFLFFTSILQAQIHHVATDGSGDFTTIAQVNAHTFVAGDSVLFRRGDTWTITSEYLTIDNSGSAGNRIVWGYYGTGAKPIITARKEVTDWNVSGEWTDRGSNIWSMETDMIWDIYQNGSVTRGRLWVDGIEVQKANSTTVPTVSLPWCHNNQTLYVYSVSNPATTFSNIESVGQVFTILNVTGDYVTIQNIDFRGGGNEITFNNADSLIFENCAVGMDCGQTGILALGCNDVILRNNIFDTGDQFMDQYAYYNNTEDGLTVREGCNDWSIYSNTFTNWHHIGAQIGTFNSTAMVNIKFHNNTITAPDIDYGHALAVGNHASSYGTCTGNEIYSNFFYDYPTYIELNGDGWKFYNNIIDGVHGSPYEPFNSIWMDGIGLGNFFGYASNNEIYNNTIMNCGGNGILFMYSGTGEPFHGNLIKNNILYNNSLVQLRVDYSPNILGSNTFENNLMYEGAETIMVINGKMNAAQYWNQTIAMFNAMNGITTNMWPDVGFTADIIQNNIGGDPLFVDPDNANYLLRDYNLSVGSPAINTGTGVGLTVDYAGNLWAASPSIGALEYDSDPPAGADPATVEGAISTVKSIIATVTGNVTDDGGGTISARGFVYGTSANPTLSNSVVTVSGTTGTYSGTLRLSSNTTYHVRAYATNESGTSYGADIPFETPVYTQGYTNGKAGYTNGKIGIIK